MTMVKVAANDTIVAPQGVFFPGQLLNLPAADAANCVALGAATLAPGTIPSPVNGASWWGRGIMNMDGFATDTVTLSAPPITGSSITLQGTSIGFVTSGATGNQVNIGSVAATLASLLALLNASADPNLVQAVYSVTGSTLNVFAAGVPFAISTSTSPASNATTTNGGP